MILRATRSLPVACASNPFYRVYVHDWEIARQFGTSKADVHATRKERIAKGVKPVCSTNRNRTPLSSSMKHERARGLVVMENGVLVKRITIEGRNTEPKKSYRQIRTNKVNIRRIKQAHQSLKYSGLSSTENERPSLIPFILMLHLIGWEDSTRVLKSSQSEVRKPDCKLYSREEFENKAFFGKKSE